MPTTRTAAIAGAAPAWDMGHTWALLCSCPHMCPILPNPVAHPVRCMPCVREWGKTQSDSPKAPGAEPLPHQIDATSRPPARGWRRTCGRTSHRETVRTSCMELRCRRGGRRDHSLLDVRTETQSLTVVRAVTVGDSNAFGGTRGHRGRRKRLWWDAHTPWETRPPRYPSLARGWAARYVMRTCVRSMCV